MTLVQEIGNYKKHYASMPGLLKGSASAVTEATHAIPVPVFANNKLPGGFDGNPPDGNAMYDDYQANRQQYADYAFRKQALDEADQQMSPSGVRVRSGDTYTTGESPGAVDRAAITDSQRQLRIDAVNTWYSQHRGEANRQRDKLLAEYSSTLNKLPDGVGFRLPAGDGDHGGGGEKKKQRDPDGYQPGGGGAATYGAGTFGAVGGAGVGAGAVHAAMPTARHAAIPSPPSSITDGIRLAGDTNPGGAGPAGGTSLSGGAGTRLPLSWSTGGGGGAAGGAGGFGAVGAGGGYGGAGGVPGAATPENGWWTTRPPSGPVGPTAPSPTAERLPTGRTGAGTAGAGSRVGMMPGAGGGAGNRTREERQTWLTEDDDEIFGPTHTAPKTNSAGAIE